MSVLNKAWSIVNQEIGVTIYEKLLKNRNLEDDLEIQKYFNDDITNGLHDPFLLNGMRESVERIKLALQTGERIIIFGDYDSDGISGAAVLIRLLKELNGAVSYRIPHRLKGGYGLSKKYVDEAKSLDVKLMITVDCGIANADEIKYAKSLGIDVIITDHHKIPELVPEKAFSIIHPLQKHCHYPYKYLTGSGVAFKLVHGLIVDMFPLNRHKIELEKYIDIAAIGTLGDMGPLTGENRVIVKEGIKNMLMSNSQGLRLLARQSLKNEDDDLTSENLGFNIIPKINASGRMDTGYYALQLLILGKDEETKINELAKKLDDLNNLRKIVSQRILDDIENNFIGDISKKRIITAYNKNWHIGVLGIVASRLVDKYDRPVFLMQENNGKYVGSSRCPGWFDVTETLNTMSKYLSAFGGHQQAAGFSLEQKYLKGFMEDLLRYCIKTISNTNKQIVLDIDCEVNLSDLNSELETYFSNLKPFGIGNKEPIFLVKDIPLVSVNTVGDGSHLKLKVANDLDVIGFNLGKFESKLFGQKTFDAVVSLQKNKWNGQEKLQLKLHDFNIQ